MSMDCEKITSGTLLHFDSKHIRWPSLEHLLVHGPTAADPAFVDISDKLSATGALGIKSTPLRSGSAAVGPCTYILPYTIYSTPIKCSACIGLHGWSFKKILVATFILKRFL